MPSQRCRVFCFNCHNRGHFGKMCKTRKYNVHEVQGGQYNQGEHGSEDPVNFPRDDSAHSLFSVSLSTKHPKGKTAREQPGRSKVMTKIQLTADPFHKHGTTIVCKVDIGAEINVISIRSRLQGNLPQPNSPTPWPSTTSYSLQGPPD